MGPGYYGGPQQQQQQQRPVFSPPPQPPQAAFPNAGPSPAYAPSTQDGASPGPYPDHVLASPASQPQPMYQPPSLQSSYASYLSGVGELAG